MCRPTGRISAEVKEIEHLKRVQHSGNPISPLAVFVMWILWAWWSRQLFGYVSTCRACVYVCVCVCVCVCIYTRVKSYFKLVWKDRSQHTKKKLDVDTCCFLCVGIKTAHIEQRFKICAILVCDRKMTLVHTLLCQIPTGRGGVWSQCKPILQ